MRVLLDNNIHYRFRRLLSGHEIVHVQDVGWDRLRNGELIEVSERSGYDVLITADKNLRYQQNLANRKIRIILINSLFIKWDHIAPLAPQVQDALDADLPDGSFITVTRS